MAQPERAWDGEGLAAHEAGRYAGHQKAMRKVEYKNILAA
jgi:hypothetical protein